MHAYTREYHSVLFRWKSTSRNNLLRNNRLHVYLVKFILSFPIYRLPYIKSSHMYVRPAFFTRLTVQHGFSESGFSFTRTNVTHRFKSFISAIIFNNLSWSANPGICCTVLKRLKK